LLLASCIGVSADITVQADGSGKIALEYRVSRMAEALGRLDGNERWQTVPVGRADFERSLARLPGMRLVSFSSTEEAAADGRGADIVTRAGLEFQNIESLLAFLDPARRRASFVREGGVNRLRIILLDPPEYSRNEAAELLELVRQVSSGYELNLNFSAAGNASLVLTGGGGEKIGIPAQAKVVSSGKQVSLSIGAGELLGLERGLGAEFSW
jgi:hypothetical protein